MLRYSLVSSRRYPTAVALCQAGADSIIGQERWKSTAPEEQADVNNNDEDDNDNATAAATTTTVKTKEWRTRLTPMSPSQPQASSRQNQKQQQEFKNMRLADRKQHQSQQESRPKRDHQLERQKKRDPLMKFFEDQQKTASVTSGWRERLQNHTAGEGSLQRTDKNKNNKPTMPSPWQMNGDEPETISDMRDVSKLRAAFLKSTNATKRAQREDNRSSSTSWRDGVNYHIGDDTPPKNGGARGYRKRMKEQLWQERQDKQNRHRQAKNPYKPWVKLDAGAFYGGKDALKRNAAAAAAAAAAIKAKKKRRSRQQQVKDSQVLLPPTPVTVSALSGIFRVKIDVIHRRLRALGERSAKNNDNYLVDIDTMEVMALDLGFEAIRSNRRVVGSFEEEQRELLLSNRSTSDDTDENMALQQLPSRPPVVCIMGHVDHGKTTLMDALRRKSKDGDGGVAKKKKKKKMKNKGNAADHTANKAGGDVAGTEAGGITQVISAFQVELEGDNAVTFLDTPGHAAFRAMRESGSHAADVIVLVIAADDGVSPQTVEILDFYKSIVSESNGGITLVVAMTKVDKPGIIVDESRYRIENELMEHGIVTESFAATTESDYGPPVQLVPVSGLTGDGLDDLIDSLVLQSEVMELRADPTASAEGIVMDARMEKGVGVVADCIVRWGCLERGNVVLSGVHCGKVKALKDSSGALLKKVLPSQPVRIIGFKTLPKAGDPITCVESEEKAEQLIERRLATGGMAKNYRSEDDGPTTLEVMGVAAQHNNLQRIHDKYDIEIGASSNIVRIPIVIKADADGTLAALRESMVAIGEESSLNIVIDPIGQGIGPISTSDVQMANLSNAAIFSFNVKQNDKEALSMIEEEGVEMKNNNVIYSLLDDAREIFANYLPTTRVEHVHGKGKIQTIFEINNSADRTKIAGMRVTSGSLHRKTTYLQGSTLKCHFRVMRDGEQVSPSGDIIVASSLKRMKDDVEEVKSGDECGLGLEGFNNFREGDIVECYSVEEKKVVI